MLVPARALRLRLGGLAGDRADLGPAHPAHRVCNASVAVILSEHGARNDRQLGQPAWVLARIAALRQALRCGDRRRCFCGEGDARVSGRGVRWRR